MSKECDLDDINEVDGVVEPVSDAKGQELGVLSRFFTFRFPLGAKQNTTSHVQTPVVSDATFYGVYIPCELKVAADEKNMHVYTDQSEALKVVKKYKQARFKAFKSMQEAVSFALRGADLVSEKNHIEGPSLTNGKISHSPMPSSLGAGEKVSHFSGPKPQEMVKLRKSIESGLISIVHDTIWENPRYLVSSGDTPAIMQEGSRYNALHVSAKAMNAEMCNLILTTVGDASFIQLLYGDDNIDSCRDRCAILVDLYLNTPDKAINETPLHFAVKYGAAEVVDLLTSYPQCNKETKNKYGLLPKDIICQRCNQNDPQLSERIRLSLTEKFYVPVLHSEDEASQPVIGFPFNPATPPNLNADVVSSRMEIRAYAGPMKKDEATTFRKKWKTPPRVPAGGKNILRQENFRLKEVTKGLETVGRNLAQELNIGWKEYWPFLDTFTDLSSSEGLDLLEKYLREKYDEACSPLSPSKHSCAPDDLSLSRISNHNGSFADVKTQQDAVLSPMSDLCVAFESWLISGSKKGSYNKVKRRKSAEPIRTRPPQVDERPLPTFDTLNPLLCIEKTCQVFAKRLADGLTYALTNAIDLVNVSLRSDVKHLQHTVATYMCDTRFKTVNFALIHARVCQLAASYVKARTTDRESLDLMLESLGDLLPVNDKLNMDGSSSEDEDKLSNSRANTAVSRRDKNVGLHFVCVVRNIVKSLSMDEDLLKKSVNTEEECCLAWAELPKCTCIWQAQQFERNSRRSSSFKRNMSTSPKTYDFVVKKLSFDNDNDKVPSQLTDVNCNTAHGPACTCGARLCGTVHRVFPAVASKELISEDESPSSSDDEDCYETASDAEDADPNEMLDASCEGAVDAFLYGEAPSKMDRLVYDAIRQCEVNFDRHPYIYRWRHNIGMYPEGERVRWQSAPIAYDSSVDSPISYCLNIGYMKMTPDLPRTPRRPMRRAACSTPQRLDVSLDSPAAGGLTVPLQVSNWLRVTGPNSPRSALAGRKEVGHNVSFGF